MGERLLALPSGAAGRRAQDYRFFNTAQVERVRLPGLQRDAGSIEV
jgi:hypothetical protein